MNEQQLEGLEKLFPKGYVIVYQCGKDRRIQWHLPDTLDEWSREQFKRVIGVIQAAQEDKDGDGRIPEGGTPD